MYQENPYEFWELWDDHREGLFRKCLKMMNEDVDDAEDALSTAMLRAREKFLDHAANIRNFKGWVLRLTENICINLLKKRKKQDIYNENTPDCLESPEDQLEREEILQKVYEEVDRLPERLREVAILYFFMRMPYRDLAMQLRLSNENIRKRIQQARAILGRQLKELMGNFSLCFPPQEKKNGSSPTWLKIKEEVENILNRRKQEITFGCTATQMVKISLPSGIDQDIPIFLKHPPMRQKIKVKTLQEYIARYPGGWKKRLQLAENLYALGKWDQAITELHQVVEKHPLCLHAWLLLGQMLMMMEQGKKAIEVYKKALCFVHNKSSKCYLVGLMKLCHQQVDAAVSTFKKAAILEPGNEIFLHTLALSLVRAHRPVEALQAFEAALSINPQDLVSLTHSYDLLVLTGGLAKAGEYVNRVLVIYPFDILALKRTVEQRCCQGLVQGEPGKKTRHLVRQLKKLSPLVAEVHEAAAVYHFYRGEWGKALSLLKNAAQAHDYSLEKWYLYSRWLYRAGDFPAAAQAILKIYQQDKKNTAVLLMAGEILSHAGKTDLLKSIIEEMLRYFPGHWQVCSMAGLALANHFNENQRADEVSRQAIRLQPLLPQAYFHHGRVLTLAGKHSQAFETVKKGWLLLPKADYCAPCTVGAWLLAKCCKNLGENAQARTWLQKVFAYSRQLKRCMPAEGYYWEGKALGAGGDSHGAVTAWRRALSCNLQYPARQEIKKTLRQYCSYGKKAH